MVQGDENAYEINHFADCDRVTEKSTGRVIVEVDKKPPDADIALSVSMYLPDGFLLEATPKSINIGSLKFGGNRIINCGTGIAL